MNYSKHQKDNFPLFQFLNLHIFLASFPTLWRRKTEHIFLCLIFICFLHVMPDNTETFIEFMSRNLSNAEKRCCHVYKESLALTFICMQKFVQYLYGSRFTLFTTSKSQILFMRLLKLFLYYQLLEYNDMQFIYKRFNITSTIRTLLMTETLILFHVFHYLVDIYNKDSFQMMQLINLNFFK